MIENKIDNCNIQPTIGYDQTGFGPGNWKPQNTATMILRNMMINQWIDFGVLQILVPYFWAKPYIAIAKKIGKYIHKS